MIYEFSVWSETTICWKCFDEATGKLLALENKGMEKLNSSPLTIHLKKCSMFIYTQFWRLELALFFLKKVFYAPQGIYLIIKNNTIVKCYYKVI